MTEFIVGFWFGLLCGAAVVLIVLRPWNLP